MEENYKVCDFYQHAFCIAEEIINFDYDICTGKELSGQWTKLSEELSEDPSYRYEKNSARIQLRFRMSIDSTSNR